MNKDIKALWIAELRNPNVKQTTGRLRRQNRNGNKDSFCCLGVLCNLHAMSHPEIAAKQESPSNYLGETSFLPKEVMSWAGLSNSLGDYLTIDRRYARPSGHNDSGKTFLQIADAIEQQL